MYVMAPYLECMWVRRASLRLSTTAEAVGSMLQGGGAAGAAEPYLECKAAAPLSDGALQALLQVGEARPPYILSRRGCSSRARLIA